MLEQLIHHFEFLDREIEQWEQRIKALMAPSKPPPEGDLAPEQLAS